MLLVEVDYPKFFMLKISKMRLKKIKNRLAAAEMNAVEGGCLWRRTNSKAAARRVALASPTP